MMAYLEIQRFDRKEDAKTLLALAGLPDEDISRDDPVKVEVFDDGAIITLPIVKRIGPEIHDYLKGLQ